MFYLCLDPGLSHTGVAISDSAKLARPLLTIDSQNKEKTINKINSLINQYRPTHIIIGQPVSGPIRPLSRQLFNELKKVFPGEIYLFPEDLSSQIAQQKLIQSGTAKLARRLKKHSAAAAAILQDFLNSSFIW